MKIKDVVRIRVEYVHIEKIMIDHVENEDFLFVVWVRAFELRFQLTDENEITSRKLIKRLLIIDGKKTFSISLLVGAICVCCISKLLC